jgi:hypothetical protein
VESSKKLKEALENNSTLTELVIGSLKIILKIINFFI